MVYIIVAKNAVTKYFQCFFVPEVVGSSPSPATKNIEIPMVTDCIRWYFLCHVSSSRHFVATWFLEHKKSPACYGHAGVLQMEVKG